MIEKLTKKQESQFANYVKRGLECGLNTDPINKNKAGIFVKKLYKCLNIDDSPLIIFTGGPLQTWSHTVFCGIIQALCNAISTTNDIKKKKGQTAGFDLSTPAMLIDLGRELVQMDEKIIHQIWDKMVRNFHIKHGKLSSEYVRLLIDAITDEKGESFRKVYHDQYKNLIWPYLDGSFFSCWVAWADYYKEVLNLELPDYSLLQEQLNFGLIYSLENFCLISERPSEIHLKEGILHCDGGAAIKYKDGFCVYALNGTRVPDWLATEPSGKIDPKRFLEIKNAQVRYEFVKKVGMARISNALNAKVVDKKGDYELLLFDIGDGIQRPYLKMVNPSVGCFHVEGVPPGIETVSGALEFRNQSALKGKDLCDDGEEWYQQGDIILVPHKAKKLKPSPTILT